MTIDELRALCEEAARDLVHRHDPPLPPTVVLPGRDRTRLVTLPDFPEDDEARHDLLVAFTGDEMVEGNVPCWGFLAQAEIDGHEVVAVAYGARRNAPQITAAPLQDDGLGDFEEPEDLDPTAMPFLHPLQHAVEATEAEGTMQAGEEGDDGAIPGWPG